MFTAWYRRSIVGVALIATNTVGLGALRQATPSPVPIRTQAENTVVGAGWVEEAVCLGCVVAGLVVIYTGLPAYIAILAFPLEATTIAVACVATCYAAFGGGAET